MSQLSPDAAAAYVARCLRLNPMWQSGEVLAARAEAHGVEAVNVNPIQAALDASARKTGLREKLYRLRDNVWKAPLEELGKRLKKLNLEGEPELQALAERLRVIVSARARLPYLTQHKEFDGDFFECFKQVLTGGPRQSAAMRERVAHSFQDKALRKRGVRMIKLLRREVPELAGLEEEWLAWLPRQKAAPGASREWFARAEGGGSSSSGCVWWVLIFIALRLIAALAKGGGGD